MFSLPQVWQVVIAVGFIVLSWISHCYAFRLFWQERKLAAVGVWIITYGAFIAALNLFVL